jgi:hypothetical protein
LKRLSVSLAGLAIAAVMLIPSAVAHTSYCGHGQSGNQSSLIVDKFDYHVWADGSYHNNTGNYHHYTTWAFIDTGIFDPGRWLRVHSHVRRCH